MRIDTKSTAIFEFKSEDYVICYNKETDEYSLNPRISREYKGKDDDIGSPAVMLSLLEVESLFKSGFSKMG